MSTDLRSSTLSNLRLSSSPVSSSLTTYLRPYFDKMDTEPAILLVVGDIDSVELEFLENLYGASWTCLGDPFVRHQQCEADALNQ